MLFFLFGERTETALHCENVSPLTLDNDAFAAQCVLKRKRMPGLMTCQRDMDEFRMCTDVRQ